MRMLTDHLELDVRPEHGMTIASLRLRGDRHNVLWVRKAERHPLPSREIGPPGTRSTDTLHELLIGGWFEMSPHAGLPGVLEGRETMLHGEALRLSWDVECLTERALEASTTCVRYPLELRRRIELDGRKVASRSTITNTGSFPVTITHGEHPCFSRAVFAGGSIGLSPLRAYVPPPLDADHALLQEGDFEWPYAETTRGGPVDVSQIPAHPDGRHDHVALELADPWVRISTAHGTQVNIHVDLDSHPYVLLWQNYRALSRPGLGEWDVFAVEPMTAPGRSIADAVSAGRLRGLKPGENVAYSFAISFST